MGKLLDTFKKIDSDRIKCIDSLNTIGIPTDYNATLSTVATKIKEPVGGYNIVKEQHMWERPLEWIDTKSLLLNAPKIEGYTAFAIHLLHDNRSTISLSLATKDNYSAYDGYYLSDGTLITYEEIGSRTVEHTWDTTKDIQTTLGYNLRYAIEYVYNDKITNKFINGTSTKKLSYQKQYGIGISLLESVYNTDVFNGCSTTITINLMFRNSSTSIYNIQRVHIMGDVPTNFSGTYIHSIKELQIDKSGSVRYEYYMHGSYTQQHTKILIPNATELTVGSGNSSDILYAVYLYIPNVKRIIKYRNYNDISTVYLYAPRVEECTCNNVTINPESMKYISHPSGFHKLTVSSSSNTYLDQLLYNWDSDNITLGTNSSLDGFSWYSTYITKINDVTVPSYRRCVKIYFPNLTEVAINTIFKDNSYMAYITSLTVGNNFKSSLYISHMTGLPTIDILDLINKLADVTNEEKTYTLTLGTTLLALLSDEEKAIATNKGWVIE